MSLKKPSLFLACSALLIGPTPEEGVASGDSGCQSDSTITALAGQNLRNAAGTMSGTTYDEATSTIRLDRQAPEAKPRWISWTDPNFITCSGDFDSDGWVDILGAEDNGASGASVQILKNKTYESPAPNWDDPTSQPRTPNFVAQSTLFTTANKVPVLGCADFNKDGKMDFIAVECTQMVQCDAPLRADIYLGRGDGTFLPRYPFGPPIGTIAKRPWSGDNVIFADYNGDSWIDMIWNKGTTSAAGGDVILQLNNGNLPNPTFSGAGALATNTGFGASGPVALALADVTGDGVRDLMLGGPSVAKLELRPGLQGGGFAAAQLIPFPGAATSMKTGDFNLDGKIDLYVTTDNFNSGTHSGGKVLYYINDGDAEPFSGGFKLVKDHQDDGSADCCSRTDPSCIGLLWDADKIMAFDYDHDPRGSHDILLIDGNDSQTFWVFQHRVSQKLNPSGFAASHQPIDLGELEGEEITITDVKVKTNDNEPPGTSIKYEVSIDGGNSWKEATEDECHGIPEEKCVSFTDNSADNKIHWRATGNSDSAMDETPSISGLEISFKYIRARDHFLSGTVARDGVIHMGAFRNPGAAGHLYAVADETGTRLWDSATKLQAQTTRTIYTAAADETRLVFADSSANDSTFRTTLNVSNANDARDVVDWWNSDRFGNSTKQRFGGVIHSTPAVLSPPVQPPWYNYASTTSSEKAEIDSFLLTYASRPQLVLVGAKDGALHAFRFDPTNFADINNGTEAWGFIPYYTARNLNTDRLDGTVSSYPDASPTVIDAKIGGAWRTILVSGEGDGGRGIWAIDVTNTVDGSTVLGPTPLWHFTDTNMGNTHTKPAIFRIKKDGAEKWLAVFASGKLSGYDVGDTVYAVDLATGALFWRFDLDDTNCYVSTNITAAEIDDELGVRRDGYIDRIFFGDSKGRIWKLDPGANSGQSISSVGSAINVGLAPRALFATALTPNALGEPRAIAGNIAVGPDPTHTRLIIYFGTGGTEETPDTAQNAFYAVYLDNGKIRAKLDASTGIEAGVKFWGGAAFSSGQLIVPLGRVISGSGLCSSSSGKVLVLDAFTLLEQFSIPTASKIVAPTFVQRGELYSISASGELVTTAYTGEEGAGGGGEGGGSGTTTPTSMASSFTITDWRIY